MSDETAKQLTDKQRAFKRYKELTAETGKPFFPHGVYHDLIAAIGVMGIIILLSTVWFAQANCDSWFNVNCDRASTPLEQEHFTPDKPGTVVKTDDGKVDETAKGPLLGPLYETKADPATTSYHPRPEWYFFFLFELLRIFTEPNLVVMGTIGLATIWLILLIAWPFLDRRTERRPSRRPMAMAAMCVTAASLLALNWAGSQAGREEESVVSEAQAAMPGYALIFEDPRGQACFSCHNIAGKGNAGPGPNLSEISAKNYGLEYQFEHLKKPTSRIPGSTMPAQSPTFTDKELLEMAAFLETLGAEDRAEQAQYTKPKL
jgi:ubiquinol-cytochrome c reductase cytochrome b subunit/menaquinol-cytochrome c reductase cytochrome b/c subunit